MRRHIAPFENITATGDSDPVWGDLADWEIELLESDPYADPNREPKHRGYHFEEGNPRYIIKYRQPFSHRWTLHPEGAANYETALAMLDGIEYGDYVIIDTVYNHTYKQKRYQ